MTDGIDRFLLPDWLIVVVDWLETLVDWMTTVFAILALLLSIYNAYTLRTLRRELRERPERATAEPERNGTPGPQEGAQRVSWWRRMFGGETPSSDEA